MAILCHKFIWAFYLGCLIIAFSEAVLSSQGFRDSIRSIARDNIDRIANRLSIPFVSTLKSGPYIPARHGSDNLPAEVTDKSNDDENDNLLLNYFAYAFEETDKVSFDY